MLLLAAADAASVLLYCVKQGLNCSAWPKSNIDSVYILPSLKLA